MSVDPDRIDYPRILQDALREVVRRVLAQVAEYGLPEDHHFFIELRTTHPGVEMPRFLREQYPEELRIVLRNQFWNLEVDEDAFSVSLNFNASRHRLVVPFAALTGFADPPAQFAVRFEPVRAEPEPEESDDSEAAGTYPRAVAAPESGKGEVLRFDPKRRK